MRVLLAAAAAAVLITPAPPATAVGSLTLDCTFAYRSGVGLTTATGWCNVVGVIGTNVVDGFATASATLYEPVGLTCHVTTQMAGTITGAVSLSFTLVRFTGLASVTTSGDLDGAGMGAFARVGDTCGKETAAHLVVPLVGA